MNLASLKHPIIFGQIVGQQVLNLELAVIFEHRSPILEHSSDIYDLDMPNCRLDGLMVQ